MDLNDVDWGASGRTDTYSMALVDPFSLQEVGTAEFVPSASSITWASDTDVLAQASLTVLTDTHGRDRDWMLRVKHHVAVGGFELDETLGTFFVEDPSRDHVDGRSSGRLNCYSTLWRMSEDVLFRDYMEAAGANALEACARLVRAAGGKMTSDLGVDPQAVLIADEFHQIGENRLEVMRTVAGSMGWRVGVGRDGDVVLTPYSRPVDRPVRYTFDDTADGIALVGFSESSTRSEAVNRVVAWWSRESLPSPDDGTAAWGLTARYMADLAEDRPFSYQRTGRRRTHAMQLSEPCSPEALAVRAEDYLEANAGDAVDITIRHPQVPGLELGDVVIFRDSVDAAEPVAWRCEVIRMSASLTPGMVCETRLRVVGKEQAWARG